MVWSRFSLMAPLLVDAWFDTGHMLVAHIAKAQLPKEQVETVERLLNMWSNDFPEMSTFVSSSVWPDHIKCTNSEAPVCSGLPATALDAFNSWHFVDLDYDPDHVSINETQAFGNPSAVWALRQAMRTFAMSQSTFAVNFMMRFAIHLLGDIHQPLHTAQGVFNDTRFGDILGDHGGNLIRIRTPWKEISNLHFLWDAAGGLYLTEWPLVQEVDLARNASAILRDFPRKSFKELNDTEMSCFPTGDCGAVFKRWVLQVHKVAINDAYQGVEANAAVSDRYITKVQEVSRRQLALAGYRLGDLLKVVIPFLQISSDTSDLSNRPWSLLSQPSNFDTQVLLILCSLQSFILVSLAAFACKTRCAKAPSGDRESPLLEAGVSS